MERSCKHGWLMPASQCPDCADIFRMEAKIEAIQDERDGYRNGQVQMQHINGCLQTTITKYAAERLIMRELIDGCLEVIETWGETQHQKTWAREWVVKARNILG